MDYDPDKKEEMWEKITTAIKNDLLYETIQVCEFIDQLAGKTKHREATIASTYYMYFVTDRGENTSNPFMATTNSYPNPTIKLMGDENVIVVDIREYWDVFLDVVEYSKPLAQLYDL